MIRQPDSVEKIGGYPNLQIARESFPLSQVFKHIDRNEVNWLYCKNFKFLILATAAKPFARLNVEQT